MIKLVAFDWNGTIIEDLEGTLVANNKVLDYFGFERISLKQYRDHFKVPIRDYWISLGLDAGFFDTHAADQERVFLENYEALESTFEMRRNVKETLEFLKQGSIQTMVFSNHIIPHIEQQLQRLGIRNYFDEILARPKFGRDHQLKRFKGEFLNSYIKQNALKQSEVAVVGDTTEEVEIGKEYGYITVALTGGHSSLERLKKADPDFLIDDLIELKDIVSKI